MRGRGSVGRCLACKNRAQYGSQMEKQGQVMCQRRGAKAKKRTETGWRPSRGRRGREEGGIGGRGTGREGGTERPTETNKKTQRRKSGGSGVGGGLGWWEVCRCFIPKTSKDRARNSLS